jgi:DNA-directed RNA polymerase
VKPSVTFTLTDRIGDSRAFSSDTMPWKLMPDEKWVQSITPEDLPSHLSEKIFSYLSSLERTSPRAPKDAKKIDDSAAKLVIGDTVHAFVRKVRKVMVLQQIQRLMSEWGGEVSESEVVHAWKTAVVSRIHRR